MLSGGGPIPRVRAVVHGDGSETDVVLSHSAVSLDGGPRFVAIEIAPNG